MIAVLIQGRLGNQLFQYAMAFSIAKELKTSFFFDQSAEKIYINKYFEIPNYRFAILDYTLFNIKGYKNLFTFYFRRNFYHLINKIQVSNHIKEEDLDASKFQNHTLYIGYFQSENYFKPYKNELLSYLTIKKEYIKLYYQKFKENFKNKKIITVHIRRGDYAHLPQWNLGGSDLRLPLTYYKQAIQPYQKDSKVLFVFIGDDFPFIEENFGFIPNKIISKESEIIDFLHLVYADVCIISNSTFSWWGAYLNQKQDKVVICPKYFLGFHLKKEYPLNIYPKNWLQHDFTA